MITSYHSATDFLAASRSLLEEREAENNLLLGLAATLSRDIRYYGDPQPLLLTIHQNGHCLGAALQTPPKNLIIYAAPEYLDSAIPELCHFLAGKDLAIPGIIGPKNTVLQFNEQWSSIRKVTARIRTNEMVYKLERVNEIPISPGSFRQATSADTSLIADWLERFYCEALQKIPAKEASDEAVKKIREGAFYLWENGQPVSMAAWTRPTRNGVTIAAVYTPPEHRQKGYATSCVATLSKLLLKKYRFCTLFTDLSNPTSNSIYQKMGYQPLEHVLECTFTDM